MTRARAVMVLGTASDVGKSMVCTALCRLFRRRGLRVAPFKSQNMSLNAYATAEGGEIGVAQALQARACGILPHTDHNPVLLKPISGRGVQVIVDGKIFEEATAAGYFERTKILWPRVAAAYQRISRAYDVVVAEGAGGAAEINLWDRDIANWRVAELADASVILVADIERGGVFASVLGTLDLLSPEMRSRVSGVIVNKFRGDPSLFSSGVDRLQELAGVPVMGVLPYMENLALPDEDSMGSRRPRPSFKDSAVNIAVPRTPHLSNVSDFLPLEVHKGVRLRYVEQPSEMASADAVVLGGSKSTVADLSWLRAQGFEAFLRDFQGELVGICGGYQMLCEHIVDLEGVDGLAGEHRGLGLLPVRIEMVKNKWVQRLSGELTVGLSPGIVRGRVSGFYIRAGREVSNASAPTFCSTPLSNRPDAGECVYDGAIASNGRVWGCHLHGVFDAATFREAWLARLASNKNIRWEHAVDESTPDPIDAWTDHVQAHLRTTPLP